MHTVHAAADADDIMIKLRRIMKHLWQRCNVLWTVQMKAYSPSLPGESGVYHPLLTFRHPLISDSVASTAMALRCMRIDNARYEKKP